MRPIGPILPTTTSFQAPASLESMEGAMLKQPQIKCPLKHRFAPGAYLREIFMPAGSFIIGHAHQTEHFNIVLSGKARVMLTDPAGCKEVLEIKGGDVFKSGVGVRKLLYILADMRWLTLHPTDETDLELLEQQLVTKSGTFIDHQTDLELLKNPPKL